jgi:type I restriction enzyme R subunit
MAVVVSQSQNEVEDIEKKGADIRPHRRRMIHEDLAEKFKDPENRLRIVFVCAMWMTGFDAPACSTIYLDKPMRNHTLMQTIARANRVFPEKQNGLIVDYIGVFRDLQKALAIYAPAGHGEMPVKDKAALVDALRQAVERATNFLTDAGIDVDTIIAADGFEKVRLMDDAVDAILVNEESKTHFSSLASAADRAFRAVMPDPATNEFRVTVILLNVLKSKMEALSPQVDISEVMEEVEELLEESAAAEPYKISEGKQPGPIDLTHLDFEALRAQFERGRRHTEAEKLKGAIAAKLTQMVRLNRSRINYLDKFQQMIDEYNSGSINVQLLFEELLDLALDLGEEQARAAAEGLSEEELAIFDLLARPEVELSKKEERAVKRIARELMETLKREKLVLDWRKRQQSRAAVRVCIEEKLDDLPDVYTPELYATKCNATYEHVYDSYFGDGESVYKEAA